MVLKDEIAEYQAQLEEIRIALVEDPGNEELKLVESELVDLITQLFSHEEVVATGPPKEESAIERNEHKEYQWQVGNEVLVLNPSKKSQSGVVVSVTGNRESPLYSVKLRGSERVETLTRERLRSSPPKATKHRSMTKADKKLESSKAAWKDFAKKKVDHRRRKKPPMLEKTSKQRHF